MLNIALYAELVRFKTFYEYKLCNTRLFTLRLIVKVVHEFSKDVDERRRVQMAYITTTSESLTQGRMVFN